MFLYVRWVYLLAIENHHITLSHSPQQGRVTGTEPRQNGAETTRNKVPQFHWNPLSELSEKWALSDSFLFKSLHLERVTCFASRPLSVLTFRDLSCHNQEGFQSIKQHCARGCLLLLKLPFVPLLAEHHAESSLHASLWACHCSYTRPVCMWTWRG